MVKRRGTTIDSPEEENKKAGEYSTKEQLLQNKKLLETKYICEVQLDWLANQDEKMRGHENKFRTEDYVKEARAILNRQKEIYSEITDDFINKFIDLIEKRREYFEGPGSEKSPTPYGCYSIDKKGNLLFTSMINKMRGKCTYFPEETRIAKMSFTADLFNLLSGDLNKLKINGEYLTYEDKCYLVDELIKKGENITLQRILKYKEVPADADVRGYRIDLKTDKPTFTEFKGYKKIKKIVKDNKLPESVLDDIETLDSIVDILTCEKSYQRREEQLRELLDSKYIEEVVDKIIDVFKLSTEFTGYHSLSKKAMLSIMEDLWHSNKNQMELFTELGLEQKRLGHVKYQSKIQFDNNAILSTVAKRAHRETIKIVNEIRKRYGELSAIVVETAKEKNSEEKRKQYKDF